MSLEKKSIIYLMFLFFLLFILKFNVINESYHWDAIELVRTANLFYEGDTLSVDISDHPSLFILTIAFIWFVFGKSILVTNLFIMVSSFLVLFFTYLIAKFLFNRTAGIIASLLLFFHPLFFAQIGIVSPQMLSAAFACLIFYIVIRKWPYWIYLLASIILIFIHTIGVPFILAISLYKFYSKINRNKKTFKFAIWLFIKYSLPLFFFSIYFIIQKLLYGIFISRSLDYLPSTILIYFQNLYRLLSYFLIDNFHFIFLFLIIYSIYYKRYKKKQMPLLHLVIIFLCFLLFFSLITALPRHYLILLPFLFIIFSYFLINLFKNKFILLIIILSFILLYNLNYDLHREVNIEEGSGAVLESNMEYLDVVRTHKQAASFIEQNYPNSLVLTNWPQTSELTFSIMGYVNKPVRMLSFYDFLLKPVNLNFSERMPDLIYYSPQSHLPNLTLNFINNHNVTLLKRFEMNKKFTEIYLVNN